MIRFLFVVALALSTSGCGMMAFYCLTEQPTPWLCEQF
jgi:hypothetical protein